MLKVDTQSAIQRAKLVHGEKYDYSKFVYTTRFQKSVIVCPLHGEFAQTPGNHFQGKGCPGCIGDKIRKSKALTLDEFIQRSNMKHNNKYDYSKFIYFNGQTKGIIICPLHGEFEQIPQDHIRGIGCYNCGHIKTGIAMIKYTTESFINDAKSVHGETYDYSKFIFTKCNEKSIIVCRSHGEFMQSPGNHLKGQGCPNCKSYKKEELCRKIFEELFEGKKFIKCRPDFLKNHTGLNLELDGYCEEEMIAFEYNGEQHYKLVQMFHKSPARLAEQQANDKFKKEKCEELGILLIIIPYTLNSYKAIRKFIINELNTKGAFAFN